MAVLPRELERKQDCRGHTFEFVGQGNSEAFRCKQCSATWMAYHREGVLRHGLGTAHCSGNTEARNEELAFFRTRMEATSAAGINEHTFTESEHGIFTCTTCTYACTAPRHFLTKAWHDRHVIRPCSRLLWEQGIDASGRPKARTRTMKHEAYKTRTERPEARKHVTGRDILDAPEHTGRPAPNMLPVQETGEEQRARENREALARMAKVDDRHRRNAKARKETRVRTGSKELKPCQPRTQPRRQQQRQRANDGRATGGETEGP